jgi:hypothetical protein
MVDSAKDDRVKLKRVLGSNLVNQDWGIVWPEDGDTPDGGRHWEEPFEFSVIVVVSAAIQRRTAADMALN